MKTIKQFQDEFMKIGICCYNITKRKRSDRTYCAAHGKHHKFWLYPVVSVIGLPLIGVDTKEQLQKQLEYYTLRNKGEQNESKLQ